MPVTQSEIAEKWNVSKGLISRYVARGMPTTNIYEAEHWARNHIYRRKLRFPVEQGQVSPWSDFEPPVISTPDPRQGDPNWRMTLEETMDVMRGLIAMKKAGASRKQHAKHLSFCTGVRLALDRGLDLNPEQWKAVRGKS